MKIIFILLQNNINTSFVLVIRAVTMISNKVLITTILIFFKSYNAVDFSGNNIKLYYIYLIQILYYKSSVICLDKFIICTLKRFFFNYFFLLKIHLRTGSVKTI